MHGADDRGMQIDRSAHGRDLILGSPGSGGRRRSSIRAVFSKLAVLVVSEAVYGGIGLRTHDARAAGSLHWSTPRIP